MPATPIHIDTITDALRLACRAPSLHNSQPWRWVITDDGVELHADPSRMIRSADATGREALISCGAVLDHFRVAMAAAGWDTAVRRLPDPADPRHIATIALGVATEVTEQQRARADAILSRRTDRLPLAAPPHWDRVAGSLGGSACRGPVQLHVVGADDRDRVAEAADLAEALRVDDSDYHTELDWWTAAFVTDEGIPRSALVSAAESDRVDIGRPFPVTATPERRAEVAEDQSGILVLCTDDEAGETVLRCGEALSAVLLDVAAAGLSSCTVSHITEVPQGRAVLATLVGAGAVPQVLVRVGRAPAFDADPPPTPRRPVHDIVEIRRGAAC